MIDLLLLLSRVSVTLGYNNLDDLAAFDVSVTRKKFPSIIVGSSPILELYNNSLGHSKVKTYSPALSCEEFQPDGKWMIPETLAEISPSLDSGLPDINSLNEEACLQSPIQFQDGVKDQHSEFLVSKDSLASVVLENDKLCQVILDKPISSIEGLSKRHSRQLEDCDFHTVGIAGF
ncbi:ATP-dependent DNA helicase-like protein RECG chloroplastic [Bienertia sinuspersici]